LSLLCQLIVPFRSLGKGYFGEVFLSSYDGKDVALKALKFTEIREVEAEVFINSKVLFHKNLVRCYGLGEMEDGAPCIVFEYCGRF